MEFDIQKKCDKKIFNSYKPINDRSTVAQMAARSPHDRKVVGSNPAGSYETRF